MVIKVTSEEYEELQQLRVLVAEVLDGRQSSNLEAAESWYRRAMAVRHVDQLGYPVFGRTSLYHA